MWKLKLRPAWENLDEETRSSTFIPLMFIIITAKKM